jgi:hypothetical protein
MALEAHAPVSTDPYRSSIVGVRALEAHAPVFTDPYQFAQSGIIGVTLGTPLPGGGVLGFDFPLTAMSRILGAYKISDRSIVVLATRSGEVIGILPLAP